MASSSVEHRQKRDRPPPHGGLRKPTDDLPKSYQRIIEKSLSPSIDKDEDAGSFIAEKHKKHHRHHHHYDHHHHHHKRHKKEREHSSRRDEYDKKKFLTDDLKAGTLGAAIAECVMPTKSGKLYDYSSRSINYDDDNNNNEDNDDSGGGSGKTSGKKFLRSQVVMMNNRINGDSFSSSSSVKPKFNEIAKKRSLSRSDDDEFWDDDPYTRKRRKNSAEFDDRNLYNLSSRLSSERNFDRRSQISSNDNRSRSPFDEGDQKFDKDLSALNKNDGLFGAGFVPGLFNSFSRPLERPLRNVVPSIAKMKKEKNMKKSSGEEVRAEFAESCRKSGYVSSSDNVKPKSSSSGGNQLSLDGPELKTSTTIAAAKKEDRIYRDYFQGDFKTDITDANRPMNHQDKNKNTVDSSKDAVDQPKTSVSVANKIVDDRLKDPVTSYPIIEKVVKQRQFAEDIEDGECSDSD